MSGVTTPRVSAALYYMGKIRLKQKNSNEVIQSCPLLSLSPALLMTASYGEMLINRYSEHLDHARIICQMGEREKETDEGEYARVVHKISEAYAAAGKIDTADGLKREVDDIYHTLVETGLYTKSDDEQGKEDYLIYLKFR
jgi:hypothetical protein